MNIKKIGVIGAGQMGRGIAQVSASAGYQVVMSDREQELADAGRVVLRASGTEPVIRVMVEGEDEKQGVALAKRLASVVAEAAT